MGRRNKAHGDARRTVGSGQAVRFSLLLGPSPRSGAAERWAGRMPWGNGSAAPLRGLRRGGEAVRAAFPIPRLSGHRRGLYSAASYGGSSRCRATVGDYTHPMAEIRLTSTSEMAILPDMREPQGHTHPVAHHQVSARSNHREAQFPLLVPTLLRGDAMSWTLRRPSSLRGLGRRPGRGTRERPRFAVRRTSRRGTVGTRWGACRTSSPSPNRRPPRIAPAPARPDALAAGEEPCRIGVSPHLTGSPQHR